MLTRFKHMWTRFKVKAQLRSLRRNKSRIEKTLASLQEPHEALRSRMASLLELLKLAIADVQEQLADMDRRNQIFKEFKKLVPVALEACNLALKQLNSCGYHPDDPDPRHHPWLL